MTARSDEIGEAGLRLRRTTAADLDFVLSMERDPENAPFIGSWSHREHLAALADGEREHWTVESGGDGARLGYLIAYDLRRRGHGVYVKRIVVAEKSRGLGRAALRAYARHAFEDLGAPWVWLSVFPENERARRAYRGIGFQEYETSPGERAALAAVAAFSERSLLLVLRPTRVGE
jgi:diamine N-acetyltransferase